MYKTAAVSGNSIAVKSFQSFAVNDGLLQKVTDAVLKGEKEARSSGEVKSFEIFYHGFRQNISIGRLFLIPASVCDKPRDFPVALLYGTVVRLLNLGEEYADLVSLQTGGEFDDTDDVKSTLKSLKEKAFTTADGKQVSLVVFAPAWSGIREYVCFQFTDDEDKLINLLRHIVFSCYFNPAVSSGFDALMTTVDTLKLDVTDITPRLTYPAITENPLRAYPELAKAAGGKKKIFLTVKTADAITQDQLEPQEMNVFDALSDALGSALKHPVKSPEEAGDKEYKKPDASADVPRADVGPVAGPTASVKASLTPHLTDPKGLSFKKKDKKAAYGDDVVVKQDGRAVFGPVPAHEAMDWVLEQLGTGVDRGGYEVEPAGSSGDPFPLKSMPGTPMNQEEMETQQGYVDEMTRGGEITERDENPPSNIPEYADRVYGPKEGSKTADDQEEEKRQQTNINLPLGDLLGGGADAGGAAEAVGGMAEELAPLAMLASDWLNEKEDISPETVRCGGCKRDVWVEEMCPDCDRCKRCCICGKKAAKKTADTADNPANEKGGKGALFEKTDIKDTRGEEPVLAPDKNASGKAPEPSKEYKEQGDDLERYKGKKADTVDNLANEKGGEGAMDPKTGKDKPKTAAIRAAKATLASLKEKLATFAKVAYVVYVPEERLPWIIKDASTGETIRACETKSQVF